MAKRSCDKMSTANMGLGRPFACGHPTTHTPSTSHTTGKHNTITSLTNPGCTMGWQQLLHASNQTGLTTAPPPPMCSKRPAFTDMHGTSATHPALTRAAASCALLKATYNLYPLPRPTSQVTVRIRTSELKPGSRLGQGGHEQRQVDACRAQL